MGVHIDFKGQILIVSLIILLAVVFFVPVEKHPIDFPATIYISDQPNFIDIKAEGQKNELDFGGISAGYKVEKFINLDIGAKSPPAKVTFKVEGTIKEFIEIPSGSFIIREPTEVNIYANIPKGTKTGTYTGKVTVQYTLTLWRKLLNSFL